MYLAEVLVVQDAEDAVAWTGSAVWKQLRFGKVVLAVVFHKAGVSSFPVASSRLSNVHVLLRCTDLNTFENCSTALSPTQPLSLPELCIAWPKPQTTFPEFSEESRSPTAATCLGPAAHGSERTERPRLSDQKKSPGSRSF